MQTIDTSHHINGTRCYGELQRADAKSPWTYVPYDSEQCHDCGGDSFRLVEQPSVLASMTGMALRCTSCGTLYPLRCEE